MMRAYLIACGAAIGFALGYSLPIFARLPNLFYDPIARRFLWTITPGAVAIGYFGQLCYGLAGALGGSGLAGLAARRPPSDSMIELGGAWVLTLLTLVGAYFTWGNWP